METFEPELVVFCCQNSVDSNGTETVRRQYGGRVRIVRMPCSGKTDVRYLLKAFESGADGVLIVG
ncbi:MAG: hydrogenase iron-sulfur subunit, partial [Candidatus Latescibacteria bacterium]|nr:hydrogenase iron-sulfur subunit [Candidatus Latescibacterota bacterium]